MRLTKGFVGAGAAMVLAVGAVYADDQKSSDKKSSAAIPGGTSEDVLKDFRKLDRNGDGFITRNEAAADKALAEKFAAGDRNKDGKLDLEEFKAVKAGASPEPT